jgi:acetyltransferase-like isoleucine patch superfamily enzyme
VVILPEPRIAATLCAISFETVTYRDLGCFLFENNPDKHHLSRIDPLEFLAGNRIKSGYYINLVSRDMLLRQHVSEMIDQYNLDRFSLIHENAYTQIANIGPGCMIYPMVTMYGQATLEKDIIVHSQTMLAHDCYIGFGCYVSAGVNIAGTTKIGQFCQFGLASVVADGITIPDNTTIGLATVVRESIAECGVYVTKANSQLTRLQ